MTTQKPSSNSFEQVRAEQLEYNAKREKGYRERALKIYPWICGRCTRELARDGGVSRPMITEAFRRPLSASFSAKSEGICNPGFSHSS
jgi:hypothetical protein